MRNSHAVKKNEIPIYETQVRKNEPEERARKLLVQSFIPAKTWAFRLCVTERCVQMWTAGEKAIPPKRVEHILNVGAVLLIEQRDAINRLMDGLLFTRFGGQDPGVY